MLLNGASQVTHLPMQETWVQSRGWEDPLEKENGNPLQYSWWRVSWTEQPGGLPSTGSQRIIHNWVTKHDWWPSWITKWVKEEIERKWRNILTKKGSTTFKIYASLFHNKHDFDYVYNRYTWQTGLQGILLKTKIAYSDQDKSYFLKMWRKSIQLPCLFP